MEGDTTIFIIRKTFHGILSNNERGNVMDEITKAFTLHWVCFVLGWRIKFDTM